MNEHYENGPEGMPRVERMTDSTIMSVLSQKNVPTIYVHSEQDYASLRLFAHAIAEETLARVPAWPDERTTSPVSQMTDEMRSALMFNAELFESHGFIDQARHLRDIVAAAEPAAPGPDPAPIYKHRDDGTVTLTNTGKMPSYADIDKVAWKIHEAHAAQPQPVAEQGELPPEWISEVCGPEVDGLSYGQGYRRGFNDCRKTVLELRAAIAASQQAAEPAAWEARRYHTNPPGWGQWLPVRPLIGQSMEEKLAELVAIGVFETRPLYAGPAIQQPQDDHSEPDNPLFLALAKKGGVAQKPNADCSGDPKSCPDNEGYGCACDPMNKASSGV